MARIRCPRLLTHEAAPASPERMILGAAKQITRKDEPKACSGWRTLNAMHIVRRPMGWSPNATARMAMIDNYYDEQAGQWVTAEARYEARVQQPPFAALDDS